MTTQMQQQRLFPNPVSNNTNLSWLCRKGIIAYFCFDFKDSQPILRATLSITALVPFLKNVTSRNGCVNMTYMYMYRNILEYDWGAAFHVPGTNKLMYSMQPDPFSWYGSGLPDCMTYLMKLV